MQTIESCGYTFELVDHVPRGYVIWNIGKNMVPGYLPLVLTGDRDGCQVLPGAIKYAVKVDGAQTILAAIGWGELDVQAMEQYIKNNEGSNDARVLAHIEKLEAALPILRTIEYR